MGEEIQYLNYHNVIPTAKTLEQTNHKICTTQRN